VSLPSQPPRQDAELVNTFTGGWQTRPSVAQDSLGNFIVIWSSFGAGHPRGVVGRSFNNAGLPQGPEFQIDGGEDQVGLDQGISFDTSAEFVVAWSAVGDANAEVFGRRFASGNQPPVVRISPPQISDISPTTVRIDVSFPSGLASVIRWWATYNGQSVKDRLLPYVTEVTSTSGAIVIPDVVFPPGTQATFTLGIETTQGESSSQLVIYTRAKQRKAAVADGTASHDARPCA